MSGEIRTGVPYRGGESLKSTGLAIFGVVAVVGVLASTYESEPTCSGQQNVPITGEDSGMLEIMTENITVTGGYVDFRGVEAVVFRKQPDGGYKAVDGQIQAGDVAQIPQTCEA